jgi:hypothetical protein
VARAQQIFPRRRFFERRHILIKISPLSNKPKHWRGFQGIRVADL